MTRRIEVDHLVVGAGAAGMAFTDALVQHADVRVALVDRRHGPGGHWLDAYPFVRLHQASQFYGVASQVLGGRVQETGPEQGLYERASQPEIVGYYARALDRLVRSGRVEFLPNSDYDPDAGVVTSRVTGARTDVVAGRTVDARYLSPAIPATTPPPFAVEDGARVVAVNDLARLDHGARHYVVVGSGKTATDTIVWLLSRGLDPDAICWVRPRDPWMLNRAVVQPDPVVFLGMAADIVESAATATSLDEIFLRLEDAGVMLRLDPAVTPTMAKAPTLAEWELAQLRSVEHVVRRGHLTSVGAGTLHFAGGSVAVPADTTVVHCAADGLRRPPLTPVWEPGTITLQPIRAGFPCFGAALVGYVEATRGSDASTDAEKNRLCPPSQFGDTLQDWARMQVLGTRAAQAFNAEPDVRAWADGVALNPARVPPDYARTAELGTVLERLAAATPAGLERLAALM